MTNHSIISAYYKMDTDIRKSIHIPYHFIKYLLINKPHILNTHSKRKLRSRLIGELRRWRLNRLIHE